MIRGEIQYNAPLAALNTWRVGGPADCLVRPADLDDLADWLKSDSGSTPLYWLGLGSNMLIRDGGVRGTVVYTRDLNKLHLVDEFTVYVQAGVTCAKLAKFCGRNGLAGATFFAGIPGTVGGALAMNAGAFGGETWPCVRSLEMIDRKGEIHQRPLSDFQVGYRTVKGPEHEWFVGATFQFERGDMAIADAQIKALLRKRGESQPIGLPSCGSVFRNPPGDYAARLIEACGLKGHRIGGAEVSTKHANFIINVDQASAFDIEQLIALVQHTVKEQFEVDLIPEVKILGETAK